MSKPTILITGAGGQIGTVLSDALRQQYGSDRVIATDIRSSIYSSGIYEQLDIMDKDRLAQLIDQYQVTEIYHLVAILSAKGEANPLHSWQINMQSLFNVLEVARAKNIHKIFFPSSIAVFGNSAANDQTPQSTYLDPTTVYGISKAAAENWCNYYHQKYGMDIRSVRYPGIIGYQSMPGGGTTDYAVEIYHSAVKGEDYTCFLKPDTSLPMLYMDDAIRATIGLMSAPAEKIKIRTSYNLAGISFTPAEVTASIQSIFPNFKVNYQPDFRQAIADSWPNSIDDSAARQDWGWQPKFNLNQMTTEMIAQLKSKLLVK